MATKSSVISGMGVAMSLVQSLVAAVKKAGGTDEDIHRLTTDQSSGVWDKIANVIVGVNKKFGEMFTLVVDYSCSLSDAVKAGGYDYVNSDITDKHFPTEEGEQGAQEKSCTLYHFSKNMQSDDIVAQMEADGKRPATARELLAFGKAHPDLQRQFPIIALKSVWVGRLGIRGVPSLSRCDSGHDLRLACCCGGWGDHCRFLAVSK